MNPGNFFSELKRRNVFTISDSVRLTCLLLYPTINV